MADTPQQLKLKETQASWNSCRQERCTILMLQIRLAQVAELEEAQMKGSVQE